MLRQNLLSVGRRPALKRVAHLLCEQLARQEAVGIYSSAIALSGLDLADAAGLSAVHISRTFAELQRRRLLVRDGRTMKVVDKTKLAALAGFNGSYLNMPLILFSLAGRDRGLSPHNGKECDWSKLKQEASMHVAARQTPDHIGLFRSIRHGNRGGRRVIDGSATVGDVVTRQSSYYLLTGLIQDDFVGGPKEAFDSPRLRLAADLMNRSCTRLGLRGSTAVQGTRDEGQTVVLVAVDDPEDYARLCHPDIEHTDPERELEGQQQIPAWRGLAHKASEGGRAGRHRGPGRRAKVRKEADAADRSLRWRVGGGGERD